MTPEQIFAGQAVYTRRVLSGYDFFVLGISNRWLWRCPTRRLELHYRAHLSANHLDVGVGSGYFLDRCKFPTPSPRLALMDMNEAALAYAAGRVSRYHPQCYVRSALAPIALDTPGFDSIGVNYLLHCLPGRMPEKAVVFDHLRPLMRPGAVLFGATLVQGDAPRNLPARRLMAFYNRKGIFSNTADTLDALTLELSLRFENVQVELVGCAALFAAR